MPPCTHTGTSATPSTCWPSTYAPVVPTRLAGLGAPGDEAVGTFGEGGVGLVERADLGDHAPPVAAPSLDQRRVVDDHGSHGLGKVAGAERAAARDTYPYRGGGPARHHRQGLAGAGGASTQIQHSQGTGSGGSDDHPGSRAVSTQIVSCSRLRD